MSITALEPTLTESDLAYLHDMDGGPATPVRAGNTIMDTVSAAGRTVPVGHTVVVDGRPANLTDKVKPGTTVIVTPNPANG